MQLTVGHRNPLGPCAPAEPSHPANRRPPSRTSRSFASAGTFCCTRSPHRDRPGTLPHANRHAVQAALPLRDRRTPRRSSAGAMANENTTSRHRRHGLHPHGTTPRANHRQSFAAVAVPCSQGNSARSTGSVVVNATYKTRPGPRPPRPPLRGTTRRSNDRSPSVRRFSPRDRWSEGLTKSCLSPAGSPGRSAGRWALWPDPRGTTTGPGPSPPEARALGTSRSSAPASSPGPARARLASARAG